ncbi:MAG: stage II sporulation protein P [Veillonellales bacterium]
MTRITATMIVFVLSCFICIGGYAHERSDGGYYSIVDEAGNVVYLTGWKVQAGDQCLTENNKRYEVKSIEGDTAHAVFIGEVNLAQYGRMNYHGWGKQFLEIRSAQAQTNGKVAIYHTHSDESYVPTDGQESVYGAGGIYKVGDAFTTALQAKGMEVVHSTAKHDPHDDMAYERSRRTAVDLLKQNPDAIFDVHRDSTPPEVYKTTINGQDVTKVQLVVGKYGATGKQIEDYALQIKAAADNQHPGLIKGIFFAKGGDYNQDLFPRSMLLEVGSHTNDRQSAERGIALFADIVPSIIGKNAAAAGTTNGATGLGTAAAGFSGASKSIGWILILLVVGVTGFLFLSTGSFKEARAKLKQFATTEFTNFFGPRSKTTKGDGKNQEEEDKQ